MKHNVRALSQDTACLGRRLTEVSSSRVLDDLLACVFQRLQKACLVGVFLPLKVLCVFQNRRAA